MTAIGMKQVGVRIHQRRRFTMPKIRSTVSPKLGSVSLAVILISVSGKIIEGDRLVDDEDLIELVYQAQSDRHEKSATLGNAQTPAETVLRLLLLKHVRKWSFGTLERQVSLNSAYRDFAGVGLGKVPDAKTLARIAQALDGGVVSQLDERLVRMAQEQGVVRGRKMRVDTTVAGCE
jgi:hypothetical protein